MSLPKDPKGMVRRDIQEEKEKQVQGLLRNKISQCINHNFESNDMQIDSESVQDKMPLQVLMSLNVIQDN